MSDMDDIRIEIGPDDIIIPSYCSQLQMAGRQDLFEFLSDRNGPSVWGGEIEEKEIEGISCVKIGMSMIGGMCYMYKPVFEALFFNEEKFISNKTKKAVQDFNEIKDVLQKIDGISMFPDGTIYIYSESASLEDMFSMMAQGLHNHNSMRFD